MKMNERLSSSGQRRPWRPPWLCTGPRLGPQTLPLQDRARHPLENPGSALAQ